MNHSGRQNNYLTIAGGNLEQALTLIFMGLWILLKGIMGMLEIAYRGRKGKVEV